MTPIKNGLVERCGQNEPQQPESTIDETFNQVGNMVSVST
jgi:hypothetical protein